MQTTSAVAARLAARSCSVFAICRHSMVIYVGLLVASISGGDAQAGLAGLTRVASGLNQPIFITHAPGDTSRLFIVQRGGAIRILDLTTGTLQTTPFLSISGVDSTHGEGGFLGLAFHPNYATNGKFYTYSTHDLANGSAFNTQIREWTRSTGDANIANPTATSTLMNFPRPQNNHVGGWIGFDPTSSEANLYIASGDGGNGDDNGSGHTAGIGNAQDTTDNWLGKMLRINVDSDAFPGDATRNYAIPASNPFTAEKPNSAPDDEIWDFGLRNPFRNSFDRATGNLWIGDVGQGAREEIDFEPANMGGRNYGWRLREGFIQTPSAGIGGAQPLNGVDPVYDYPHAATPLGGIVVTGGYVYRGPDPTLQGKYFFLDSNNSNTASDDNYWMFDPANPTGTVANIDSQLTPNTGTANFPVSFGEDGVGNLYIAYIGSGEVFRINTNAFQTGDFNGDAKVDAADLTIWKAGFGTATGATRLNGDANADGSVDGDDFIAWQRNVGWSPLSVVASAAVPEPASALLLLTAVLLIPRRRLNSSAAGR